MATIVAFVTAGAVSLCGRTFLGRTADRFVLSTVLGSPSCSWSVRRARVGAGTWWANGLEILGLGVIEAMAYYSGALVAALLQEDS